MQISQETALSGQMVVQHNACVDKATQSVRQGSGAFLLWPFSIQTLAYLIVIANVWDNFITITSKYNFSPRHFTLYL